MDEKKDAPALAGQGASDVSPQTGVSDSTDSIQQSGGVSQGKSPHKSGKFGRHQHILKLNAKAYSVAIKCYDEQLPYGLDYVKNQLMALDKRLYQAMGIVHDRDTVEDGAFWEIACVKRHIHIILRVVDRKKRFRLDKMLEYLGIVFRPKLDDKLWAEHGVETVGNFAGYALYLTHETPDAIRDGKELYALTEVWSNLDIGEVEQIREGYTRVCNHEKKVSTEDLIQLDEDAYKLGYELGNFESWYGSQPFIVRSSARMKTIRESYHRGISARVEEHTEMVRLCVYIRGEANTGKTYAAQSALAGERLLYVRGGGTGKFDALRPDHTAILLDDEVAPNLLNMCDNYLCWAYKRNRDNPVWAGRYFVVTSNLPFAEWLKASGMKIEKPYYNPATGESPYTRHYEAMRSRFYICDVVTDEATGVSHLACRSVSDRGSVDVQMERANMFWAFKQRFDATIAGYVPGMNKVDYSRMIEPVR